MELLQQRDQFTERNQRLVSGIQNGQKELESYKAQKKESSHLLTQLRKELADRKNRKADDLNVIEKKQKDIKKVKSAVLGLKNKITKTSEYIVNYLIN